MTTRDVVLDFVLCVICGENLRSCGGHLMWIDDMTNVVNMPDTLVTEPDLDW